MSLSADLVAANERLLARRSQLNSQTRKTTAAEVPWEDEQSALSRMLAMPPHLGWGSQAATLAVRTAQRSHLQRQQAAEPITLPSYKLTKTKPPATTSLQPGNTYVAALPDIVLAMLSHSMSSQGRLWLLLRYLDETGRGWHEHSIIRHQFTKTVWRFCGRRQLSNLLKAGEGVFWRTERHRIWLFSAARVAKNLGVEHITYRSVTIPCQALLGRIGEVRAHFYATFHSARTSENEIGMPIARETITTITGVDADAQRSYEKLLNLDVKQNIAIGERIQQGEEAQTIAQERAWRHGRALFKLTDHKGKQGPKGRAYHAWQLPNSYGAIHTTESRSKRRRLNRQLIDLQNKGAGNDLVGRRYFANGKLLEHACGSRGKDRYYQTGRFGPISSPGRSWSVSSTLVT